MLDFCQIRFICLYLNSFILISRKMVNISLMYSQTMILYAINRPILHNDILKKIKKQKKKEYSKCRKNSSQRIEDVRHHQK